MTAPVHDSQAMKKIPVKSSSYYIFDQAYNFFAQLYRLHCAGAFFVVRANKNIQYKAVKWKRRMLKNVMSDSTSLRSLCTRARTIIRRNSDGLSTTMGNKTETLYSWLKQWISSLYKLCSFTKPPVRGAILQMCEAASEDQEIRGISHTDTTSLEYLFNKTNLNIVKELDEFYEPTLFDF